MAAGNKLVLALVLLFSCLKAGFGQETREVNLLDAEQAFNEARVAAAEGDLGRAITSLERVLIARPGLTNIQFELGLLYSRVGATKRAQFYLQESLKDPNMPRDIRDRAESELAKLDASEAPRTRFGGSVGVGIQTDTNPASATDLSNLTNNEGGLPSQVSEIAEQDFSARLNTSFFVNRQLGRKPGFEWRNRLSLFTNQFVEQTELNTTGYSGRTGLRIPVGRNEAPLVHSPYVSLSGNTDSDNLSAGYGLQKFAESWQFNANVSGGMVRYRDDDQALFLDSERYTASFGHGFDISVSNRFDWSVGLTRNDAIADDQTFDASNVSLGLTHRRRVNGQPVSASGTIRRLDRRYDGFDLVDLVSRADTTNSVEFVLNVGLSQSWRLRWSATYLDNQSNVRRLRYENLNSALSLTYQF